MKVVFHFIIVMLSVLLAIIVVVHPLYSEWGFHKVKRSFQNGRYVGNFESWGVEKFGILAALMVACHSH